MVIHVETMQSTHSRKCTYQGNLTSLTFWKFPSREISVFDLGCFSVPVSDVTRGTSPTWEHHLETFDSLKAISLPAHIKSSRRVGLPLFLIWCPRNLLGCCDIPRSCLRSPWPSFTADLPLAFETPLQPSVPLSGSSCFTSRVPGSQVCTSLRAQFRELVSHEFTGNKGGESTFYPVKF